MYTVSLKTAYSWCLSLILLSHQWNTNVENPCDSLCKIVDPNGIQLSLRTLPVVKWFGSVVGEVKSQRRVANIHTLKRKTLLITWFYNKHSLVLPF